LAVEVEAEPEIGAVDGVGTALVVGPIAPNDPCPVAWGVAELVVAVLLLLDVVLTTVGLVVVGDGGAPGAAGDPCGGLGTGRILVNIVVVVAEDGPTGVDGGAALTELATTERPPTAGRREAVMNGGLEEETTGKALDRSGLLPAGFAGDGAAR
jgi:hypothetical protein